MYRKRVSFFAFYEVAFGYGSPVWEGVRKATDVLGSPLELALRSMWLDLGKKQGYVRKPERKKRAPRRK